MEEDRAQVDLGIAADIEAAQLPESAAISTAPAESSTPLKQPKKRFVGKRAADAAKTDQAAGAAASKTTDIQSMHLTPYGKPKPSLTNSSQRLHLAGYRAF